MGMRLREFAGKVNDCDEVLVPVFFADHEDAVVWLAVKKSEVKEAIIEKAKELEIEEIDAELDEEDNCLYITEPEEEEVKPDMPRTS